ncbi:hypothetical protein O7623_18270 [Solwaraspora sp. WMMD791]|uniref:hypothetical protein n=1 Tax=Solwaraspora sp. WMMD791 TaxID=3016086 RepID=UPI00249A21DB|nr:hypothetical protein [Solwaraspora sp. WMMD791]WFE25341.1 hypothetical protein O7623_18270 [Solwaraspora sp. WMMD791]
MGAHHVVSTARTTVVLVVAVLTLAACGGGPSPVVWAAEVCTALRPWRTEISNLTSSTQQQMTAQTTPAQAQENLVRLLAGAEAATETARTRVADAGIPDADQGEQVATGFVASLSAVRDAYGKAEEGIAGLDASGPSETFYDGVEAVLATLTDDYQRSALDTSSLDSAELNRAFDEVPECR